MGMYVHVGEVKGCSHRRPACCVPAQLDPRFQAKVLPSGSVVVDVASAGAGSAPVAPAAASSKGSKPSKPSTITVRPLLSHLFVFSSSYMFTYVYHVHVCLLCLLDSTFSSVSTVALCIN